MLASTDPGLASTGSAIVSAAGGAHVRGAGSALPFLRAESAGGRTWFADWRAQARLIRTGPQAPRLLSHSFSWRIRPQFRKVCSFHSRCPPGESAAGPRRPRLERGGHGAGAGTSALFPHSARASAIRASGRTHGRAPGPTPPARQSPRPGSTSRRPQTRSYPLQSIAREFRRQRPRARPAGSLPRRHGGRQRRRSGVAGPVVALVRIEAQDLRAGRRATPNRSAIMTPRCNPAHPVRAVQLRAQCNYERSVITSAV